MEKWPDSNLGDKREVCRECRALLNTTPSQEIVDPYLADRLLQVWAVERYSDNPCGRSLTQWPDEFHRPRIFRGDDGKLRVCFPNQDCKGDPTWFRRKTFDSLADLEKAFSERFVMLKREILEKRKFYEDLFLHVQGFASER